MLNLYLIIIEALITYFAVYLIDRYLKLNGDIAWVAIATILANVLTSKTVTIIGVDTTLGTTLFASIFLTTDIITEKYGAKFAKKGMIVGLLGSITLIVFTSLGNLYIPSEFDIADESMHTLFSVSLRVTLSSIVMYFIANMADIVIYDRLRKCHKGKKVWLRNNLSTIFCNCLENFLFMFGAFLGIYDIKTILIMATSTSILEIILGLADTPFLYMSLLNDRRKPQ